ncbi:hypothetical protein DIURU_000386 [Diutina rugosa]|uniref:DNA polymerase V n=1 Tax=Diutina rugosa TaxID=5481 RepID=A0A642UY55_DIURU|nr:uncharacterized protein DIURU_000386 [Diutina rugosa]KAA8907699.1 hypothetical protein DIURU_000386 [Diutina rugosa]
MAVSRDHYFRLGSDLPDEQIAAAAALIGELKAADDAAEWDYAHRRLIKGLTTSKQSARYGFSVALTEVLSGQSMTTDEFLDQLDAATEVKSSMKGKEQRSVLFGRLFGLQALLNSKRLYQDYKQAEVDRWLNTLVKLASERSWLRETAMFTLVQFVKAVMTADDVSDKAKQELATAVLELVKKLGLAMSCEGVAVYLAIPQKMIKVESGWKHGFPFAQGNLPKLAKALKDTEVAEDDEETRRKSQKSTWSPQLPFVWDMVLAHFNQVQSSPSKKAKHDTIGFKELWQVVVEEGLFNEKSSHERKYWGFEILAKFVVGLNRAEDVAHLFTPNVMQTMINSSTQKKRYLHNIAVKAIEALQQAASANCGKGPVILDKLLKRAWNFDNLTKTKTIDKLLVVNNSGSEFEQQSALNELVDIFKARSQSDHEPEAKWGLDRLVQVVRSNRSVIVSLGATGDAVMESVLGFLVRLSLFPSEASAGVVKYAQDKLNSVLAEVVFNPRADKQSWSLWCINEIVALEKKQPLAVEFDDELKACKNDALQYLGIVSELQDKSPAEFRPQLYCFELMFSMVLLQLYLCDEEALQVLGELRMCFEQTFLAELDNGEFDTSVVLTEILLSLSVRKSSLTRRLVSTVWGSFMCTRNDQGDLHVTPKALDLLYEVLVTKENKQGQLNLFEGEGEYGPENEGDDDDDDEDDSQKEDDDSSSDSDSDSDSDDEDDDDDEAEKKANPSKKAEDDDDEDDDSDTDSSDSNDNANTKDQLDEETRKKLAEALGVDNEVKFEDMSSDDDLSESSMDDDEMMEMDGELSRIFKERRDALEAIESGNKQKKEAEDAKEQMVFFKNRVLDLLEVFNKAEPNHPYNLTMIPSLLDLIRMTTDKNLGVKAHKLLKTKVSKTKVPAKEVQEGDADNFMEMLKLVQDKASQSKCSQSYSLACGQACIVLAKNIVSMDATKLDDVIDVYTQSLKTWAAPGSKSKIQPSLFFDFINWLQSKRQSH